MVDKLRLLKEYGITWNEPSFTVMYDRFTDSFILDIPSSAKRCTLYCKGKEYLGDGSSLYPYSVTMGSKSYSSVWEQIEPYSKGVSLDMIPIEYSEECCEYISVQDSEDNTILIDKSDIIPF